MPELSCNEGYQRLGGQHFGDDTRSDLREGRKHARNARSLGAGQRGNHRHDPMDIAAVLVIAGIVTIVRGGVLWGIVLIVAGLLVGPGGVSLFD
jgi:hypothetical protein